MLDKCKLRSCYNNLWRDPVASFDAPPGLKVDLFPHQSISVSWMIERERGSTPHGGILADDMGLGKTIQLISLILAHGPQRDPSLRGGCYVRDTTTLIVCPKSVIAQWAAEMACVAPSLSVYEYCGPNRFADRLSAF